MNDLNVTSVGRNVYNHSEELNVTGRRREVTFMRIGQHELKILGLLMEKEGRVSFFEVKQKLCGEGRLNWRKMGYDKHHDISVQHKSLVRATKTLEEKGLAIRSGFVSHWNKSKITRIKFLEITKKGKEEYLKRVGVA